MRLVFVTQVLDREDAVLGFVCRWVEGLAQHAESVRVIALEVGDVSGFPPNVSVRELGRRGRLSRLLRYHRLLREAFGQDGFQGILTHMVPRYSTHAAGMARRYGAAHGLWYTHKGVDGRLRKGVRAAQLVFTASAESMRIDTDKKRVTGHGIDLQHFPTRSTPTPFAQGKGPARLLSVGRLTPAKDPLCVLNAVAALLQEGRDVRLDWAGGALAAGDQAFGDGLRERVRALGMEDRVHFLGDVSYGDIPGRFAAADVFLSASRTGSVDKVVLEAMASGVPVVTCNESFPPIFAALKGDQAQGLYFEKGHADELALRTRALLDLDAKARQQLGRELRLIVERDHEVDGLMQRLVLMMRELQQ